MNDNHPWLPIITVFFLAFILTLLPMPAWTVWLRPAWVLLALIYWSMYSPYQVSVGIAWIIGIFLDVLNGTVLGEHALALTIVTYFVVRTYSRLRMYTLLQQSLCILIYTFVYQLILYCTQGVMNDLPRTWMFWLSPFVSMLLWPWVFIILRHYRRDAKSV